MPSSLSALPYIRIFSTGFQFIHYGLKALRAYFYKIQLQADRDHLPFYINERNEIEKIEKEDEACNFRYYLASSALYGYYTFLQAQGDISPLNAMIADASIAKTTWDCYQLYSNLYKKNNKSNRSNLNEHLPKASINLTDEEIILQIRKCTRNTV